MEKLKYIKKCNQCNRDIEYKNLCNLKRSISKNSLCKSCYNINRKVSIIKTYERNCPTCDKIMVYKSKESLRYCVKSNSNCNSCAKLGINNPSFGKAFKHTIQTIEKIRKSNTGKKKTKEMIKNAVEGKRKKYIKENHPNWKGGVTDINTSIRKSLKYKEWRTNIFIRDNYTCKICNIAGLKLNAHHIKSFISVINTEDLYDINNGVTLCKYCHNKFHKEYGIKNFPSILETHQIII